MRFLSLIAPILALSLAACGGGKNTDQKVDGVADEALPTPSGTAGSGVTGMPNSPGPGQIGPPAATGDTEIPVDADGNPLLPTDAVAADGTVPDEGDAPASSDEPTPDDAVALIRDYYAAINARDYTQAYVLWSDAGRASGKSAQAFAEGFNETESVSVQIQPPGHVEAAAGSRYVEILVTVTATQRDGGQTTFIGNYVLRRAVVEGATAEQRAWRIGSAELREQQFN